MYNLVIVGAGQLGSRHLQGLALLNCQADIYVVDKNIASLEVAKQRFEEARGTTEGDVSVTHLTDIDLLPAHVDVAIIATTSDVRRDIVEFLVKNKAISYFVLEKVLFNKVDDYAYIQTLLAAKGIKAWVNCSRRVYDCYRQLRTLLRHEDFVALTVEGTNWGLGCNAIHFIDLLAFLSNCNSGLSIDTSQLDKGVSESKRTGFIEFTGTLRGSFEGKNTFQLTSRAGELPESFLQINSPNYQIEVDERKGEMVVKRRETGGQEELFHITLPFQSRLTNKVVEEILLTGESRLCPYEESMSFHIPLINAFLTKLRQDGVKTDVCNVT